MHPTQRRLVEKLETRREPFSVCAGHVFTRRQDVISPATQACDPVKITPADAEELLRQLGGQLVQWTDGFRPDNAPGEWYSVIARRFVPLERMNSKKRYRVRQSLEACTVRRLPAKELAVLGHAVHLKACRRYGQHTSRLPGQDAFRARVTRDSEFADIIHHWGIFRQDTLIGYATNHLVGSDEVYYSSIKLDPDHFDCAPGYALIHTMNRYYLEQCGFAYVNDGFRSLLHATRVQDFLFSTFGFEKAYTTLHVHYRSPLNLAVSAVYPLRGLLGGLHPKLGALLELEHARRHPVARVPPESGGKPAPRKSPGPRAGVPTATTPRPAPSQPWPGSGHPLGNRK